MSEGLEILREQGVGGLRIDRIADRLRLTKGSFHHHFDGIGDYRASLLERYELEVTARMHEAVSAVQDLLPEKVLTELPSLIPFDPGLDAAIRGWASQDPVAREALQRIDTARLQLLTDLWVAVVTDPHQARIAALVPHLIMIGASVAQPTPEPSDIKATFELLAHLTAFVAE